MILMRGIDYKLSPNQTEFFTDIAYSKLAAVSKLISGIFSRFLILNSLKTMAAQINNQDMLALKGYIMAQDGHSEYP